MSTFAEMLAKSRQIKHRRPPRDEEHQLQCACVQWFRITHKQLWRNLIAIPNGGRRDKATGGKLKAEGVVAGASDLILLYPSGEYSALLIEMKTPTGRQSQEQRIWQQTLEAYGYKYIICRSLDDFILSINTYLKLVPDNSPVS